MSDECLSTLSLEMSSALAPVNWNLKGEILYRLRKSCTLNSSLDAADN